MVTFQDMIYQSLNGPVMSEQDFDLKLSRKLRDLTSHYSIRFSPDEVVCDDALADSVWQAGLDLLEQVGLYNLSTNRTIMVARDEAVAVGSRAPKEFSLGADKDAVLIEARTHNSRTPLCIVPEPASTILYKGGAQGICVDMWKAYREEAGPLGDLARRLPAELEGVPFLADTPGEMLWARAICRWKVAIVESMGKPGLHVGTPPVTSVAAILACFLTDHLLNKTNSGIPAHIMPELKLNWDRLNLILAAREMGVPSQCGVSSVLGAYCRSPEETSVVLVAAMLGRLACSEGQGFVSLSAVDLEGHRSSRAVMNALCGASRAIERNLNIPVLAKQRGKNGHGTNLRLYELAATTIAETCAGVAWGEGFICHPGENGEYRTELDYQLVTDLAKGAAGLEREAGNELVGKLLALYEGQDGVQEGRPFSHYYNLKTLTPAGELVRVHDSVRAELGSLGVPLS